MPMITVGHYTSRYEGYMHGKRPAPEGPEARAWISAIKRTERNLRVLGFTAAEAWRLAIGEP